MEGAPRGVVRSATVRRPGLRELRRCIVVSRATVRTLTVMAMASLARFVLADAVSAQWTPASCDEVGVSSAGRCSWVERSREGTCQAVLSLSVGISVLVSH